VAAHYRALLRDAPERLAAAVVALEFHVAQLRSGQPATPDLPLVDAIGKELALAREIAPEGPALAAFEAELRQFTMPE